MSNPSVRKNRIRKEIQHLLREPPPGILFWSEGGDADLDSNEERTFSARLAGPLGSCYEGGSFYVEIRLGVRYPFEAPGLRFITKIFHPNVDEAGRICLDSLKLPPAGSWRPSLNLHQVLSQISILLVEPGLSDPLMKDAAELYKNDRERFFQIAKEWTAKYASAKQAGGVSSSAAPASSSSFSSLVVQDSKRLKVQNTDENDPSQ